jgi:predicted N-acetyltransferase YhbS
MNPTLTRLVPNANQDEWKGAAAAVWAGASPPGQAVTLAAVDVLLQRDEDRLVRAILARVADQPAGVIIASSWTEGESEALAAIDLVAVLPRYQRQGIGSVLLREAIGVATERGVPLVTAGGGLRFVAPGPGRTSSGALAFFSAHDFRTGPMVWDFEADLRSIAPLPRVDPQITPTTASQVADLRTFLRAEFPPRWERELRDHLALGGEPGDYLVLVEGSEIIGFCRAGTNPLVVAREFGRQWPEPHGELGPIGVAARFQGSGHGRRLVQAGLARLRDRGVRGCRIGWTTHTGFYERFGFVRTCEYLPDTKSIGG